ncbi:MAG: hypothetical protein H6933_18240 [Burkholderiaceae bacterium]|nr:hypothetical protein [Burkholderiaceae bacterium]
MADPASFARLMPGFDFLQGLIKGAGESLPGMGQWIAPSLDPEEIDKRIRDLRTVQFWLEQNTKMIGATIQALEVQRMTLNTLQGMNVPVDALREAMTMKAPAAASAPAAAPAAPRKAAAKSDAAPAAPGVDPMAWWGALTQQFGEIASNAMKDLPAAASAAAAAATAAAGASAPAPAPTPAASKKKPARARSTRR